MMLAICNESMYTACETRLWILPQDLGLGLCTSLPHPKVECNFSWFLKGKTHVSF